MVLDQKLKSKNNIFRIVLLIVFFRKDTLQQKLGFAIPLFRGRGVFNYNFGILPFRHPIHVVIGEPIEVPKVEEDKITPDLINEYHEKYINSLDELYNTYKDQFDKERKSELKIE